MIPIIWLHGKGKTMKIIVKRSVIARVERTAGGIDGVQRNFRAVK